MKRNIVVWRPAKLITGLILILAMAACSQKQADSDLIAKETVPETSAVIQTPAEYAEVADEAFLAPAEEQNEKKTTLETQPPEEESLALHSGLREDGSFDQGTLFLGDSLTYMLVGSYLKPHALLGEAKYAAMCGSKVTAFFNEEFRMGCHETLASGYSEVFYGMTFREVVDHMGDQATAIYMMWGTNYEPNATTQTYIDLVEYVLGKCPQATIHMQLIPYGNVPYSSVNEMVTEAYSYFVECGEPRVFLIDTFTAIGKYPVDGVHQGEGGNRRWYEAIAAHAETYGLGQ